MTIKLYVNFDEKIIMPEKEYEEFKQDRINDYFDCDEDFNCWVDDNYSAMDIWRLSAAERDEICQEWLEACEETFERNDLAELDCVEIEI